MNFLMRSNTQHVVPESLPAVSDVTVEYRNSLKASNSSALEGHIPQDCFSYSSTSDDHYSGSVRTSENGYIMGTSTKNDADITVDSHLDVREEEGWIIVPDGMLPGDLSSASNSESLRSLDRPFVFPGEQVYMVACLTAHKQDTEVITPFKVAAVMSKNGIGNNYKKSRSEKNEENSSSADDLAFSGRLAAGISNDSSELVTDQQMSVSASESIIRMENCKRQTETLLQRFKNSHFFVRIAESDEPLWAKRESPDPQSCNLDHSFSNRDRIEFDKGINCGNLSGGIARSSFNCCSLPNGDILVILQVSISSSVFNDPTVEILQFEKHRQRNSLPDNCGKLHSSDSDPCGDLLKWLLPLDNTIPPPPRPLSPPQQNSSLGVGGTSQRPISSGSQLLSHLRSYSMSALPQNTSSHHSSKMQNTRPSFDLEDWDLASSQKFVKVQQSVTDGLLSFRGVALERERFSVCCGLEGIYVPGRRWRRKLRIIHPISIRSYASDCNSSDFLCVRIQNISPEIAKDVVVYVDAVTVVLEASNGDPPLTLPISCVEAGNEHSLPNLALRSGEEHSFILKPVCSVWKNDKLHRGKISPSSSLRLPQHSLGGRKETSSEDKYSIIVSCRSNYSASSVFFKQSTTWRPRLSRDIMISVVSDVSGDSSESNERMSHLPVQVLTLQASNLTSKDLTMTVLAPASYVLPPSVGSMSSSPTSPMSPFVVLSESAAEAAKQNLTALSGSVNNQKSDGNVETRSISFNESVFADVFPKSLSCTHLWLQSRVPLGCVPAQSTATVKLELLPLTNGIISLDTLQIEVKERDLTYVPERPLQIHAISSISSGVS